MIYSLTGADDIHDCVVMICQTFGLDKKKPKPNGVRFRFLLAQREGFVLEFCKTRSANCLIMSCKILRSPLKNISQMFFLTLRSNPSISFNNEIKWAALARSTTHFIWRRERDSNPRGIAPKLISSQHRYDRFDISAYQIA